MSPDCQVLPDALNELIRHLYEITVLALPSPMPRQRHLSMPALRWMI